MGECRRGEGMILYDSDTYHATTIPAKDLTVDDITLAKALQAFKTSKPKIRGIIVRDHKEPSKLTTTPTLIADSTRPKAKDIVMQEPSEATTKTTILLPSQVKDKGKGKLAKIEAEFELAQRLQVEEQEQLTDAEKERLFIEFLQKRRKFFAAKRNRPPIKAQQRSIMSTYLKNMDVEESSKKAEESSSKRARDKLEQENAKKHKVDDDQEVAELKKCLEIGPDDEDDVTTDATTLSSKSPTIVDYKIYKEGRKSYF
nr:hypothetical protein [Tanacetum cinerariifolium]GEV21213.1 hypothetical protein [Tanacetum cinerariifolium]